MTWEVINIVVWKGLVESIDQWFGEAGVLCPMQCEVDPESDTGTPYGG